MTDRSERRVRRSEIPAEAMNLYLQAVAQRSAADVVVVADCHGFLVSGAGTSKDSLTELAALSSLGKLRPREMEFERERFSAQRLTIEDEALYVGTMGEHPVPEPEVSNAVKRILLF